MPNITITNWPALRTAFNLAVDHDTKSAFCPVFQRVLSLSTLSRPLDTAIVNAARVLYIDGKSSPTPVEETEWQHILRWEICTFWHVDHSAGNIETQYRTNGKFGHEHAKRSGEYLAMGLALTLLDAAGIASPSSVYFLDDAGSRPDFIIKLFTRSRRRIFIEARSRQAFTSVASKERNDILKKKSAVSYPTLVVYFQHGVGTCHPRKGLPPYQNTRLFLVDPVGDESVASVDEVAATMLRNYSRFLNEIGLHYYVQLIDADLQTYHETGLLPRERAEENLPRFDGWDARHPNLKSYGRSQYTGRYFSSLVSDVQSEYLSMRNALDRLRTGEFGYYEFRGINMRVLRRILRCRWESLVRFRDSASDGEWDGATITSDGIVNDITVIYDTTSRQAEDVRETLAQIVRNKRRGRKKKRDR